MGLNHSEPDANLLEHLFGTACGFNLCVARLNIEHWRKVALLKTGVLDEVLGLSRTRGFEREEMVGSDGDMVFARLSIVGGIKLVGYGNALGALYEDERYGVIGRSADILVVSVTKEVNAEFVPQNRQ